MKHCKFVKFFIITKMKVQNKMQEITRFVKLLQNVTHSQTGVLLKFAQLYTCLAQAMQATACCFSWNETSY